MIAIKKLIKHKGGTPCQNTLTKKLTALEWYQRAKFGDLAQELQFLNLNLELTVCFIVTQITCSRQILCLPLMPWMFVLQNDDCAIGAVRPVCLPSRRESFPAGAPCWVTGWGYTKEGGESALSPLHINYYPFISLLLKKSVFLPFNHPCLSSWRSSSFIAHFDTDWERSC